MKDLGNYECEGQMELTDWLQQLDQAENKNAKLQSPCNRLCEYEWGARECFIKRGYFWDKNKKQWMRNMKGEVIKMTNPDCDWLPEGETK